MNMSSSMVYLKQGDETIARAVRVEGNSTAKYVVSDCYIDERVFAAMLRDSDAVFLPDFLPLPVCGGRASLRGGPPLSLLQMTQYLP
jgi:hypothetical protein